jgi:hypothetical protein
MISLQYDKDSNFTKLTINNCFLSVDSYCSFPRRVSKEKTNKLLILSNLEGECNTGNYEKTKLLKEKPRPRRPTECFRALDKFHLVWLYALSNFCYTPAASIKYNSLQKWSELTHKWSYHLASFTEVKSKSLICSEEQLLQELLTWNKALFFWTLVICIYVDICRRQYHI